MPFYLFKARYSAPAIKAMIAKPQDREAAAKAVIEAIGGTLHHFFFAMGDDDIVCLIEAPSDEAMAAGAMIVGASGSLSGVSTTKLLTAAQAHSAMETAHKASSSYAPPA
jgi:uncharacterized protein with GYD domain